MKKVAVIGVLVAIVGFIAAAITAFYWLARQIESINLDFEDDDLFI